MNSEIYMAGPSVTDADVKIVVDALQNGWYGKDACVDVRKESKTFGQWYGVELSDWADLHYKVSATYDPGDEGGLLWRDENIGVQWPIDSQIISNRDDSYPLLVEL